jgi:LmbE family N-acetylglucosaminyl deacetylase
MTRITEMTRQQIDPIQQVTALGNIVSVWAHPDDESYLAAGVMAIASAHGARVTCVTATDGELADTFLRRRSIARRRRAELAAALDSIGVTDRARLGLRDGGCAAVDDEGPVALIAAVIADRSPDTIITFGPDGLTGHPDHQAVSRWTTAAARLAGSDARILHTAATADIVERDGDINGRFGVFEPGYPTIHGRDELSIDLTLDGQWLDMKLAALQAHASQTGGLIDALGIDRYRRWIAPEMFVDA